MTKQWKHSLWRATVWLSAFSVLTGSTTRAEGTADGIRVDGVQRMEPPQPDDDRVECPGPDQLSRWFRQIGEIRADISTGDRKVPRDCSADLFQSGGSGRYARTPAMSTLYWAAPELWHQPLYFDDVPLENYGRTKHPRLQPAISAGRFFLSIPAIPYKMSLDRPFSCISTLGTYTPGNAAPCVLQLPPWDPRAAIVEGTTIAGLILLLQ